ncbi:ABC-type multidrug transport system, ATPase component [Halapricum desulfuricans]|uniref:ABC-type multidrug transport system, ATPase component n=1 Tax=Halapricum desulfuricans TaxID=2841257 RepID=A0A897MX42_9EURY|nr:ABC-type multidrug transport system, ATPase component [Halapricum desulfuricans]
MRKRYGSGSDAVLALDDLDLTVREGEVFGFLGPNGAGKSTTINVLLDFIEPTAGHAEVLGHDVRSESKAIRARTGVLPEGFEVFERLTAREHLEWMADTKGVSVDADAVLETVGIAEAADRAAGDFSKGMTQRLALGMALVGDPDLLILDEPSSGLDPTGMREMRELVREQAASGTTVFFSSHILSEVEAVCDRVAILNEGELMIEDTIENLRDANGGTASIQLDVASVPEGLDLQSIDGVRDVTVRDGEITAVCSSAARKVDVVRHVDERTAVTDIVSEDTSLEELFQRYTGQNPGTADSAASNTDASGADGRAESERAEVSA